MQTEHGADLYASILRYATVPVLLLLIVMSLVIINFLMSTKWQQARRSKQIRKAVAAREALMARHRDEIAETDVTAPVTPQRDKTDKPSADARDRSLS